MATLNELISANSSLSDLEEEHLAELVAEWRLLADLSFADLVLWLPIRKERMKNHGRRAMWQLLRSDLLPQQQFLAMI